MRLKYEPSSEPLDISAISVTTLFHRGGQDEELRLTAKRKFIQYNKKKMRVSFHPSEMNMSRGVGSRDKGRARLRLFPQVARIQYPEPTTTTTNPRKALRRGIPGMIWGDLGSFWSHLSFVWPRFPDESGEIDV